MNHDPYDHTLAIVGTIQTMIRLQNHEGSREHFQASESLRGSLRAAFRDCRSAPVATAIPRAPDQACAMECGLRRAMTDAMGIAPDADPIAHARDMRDWAERVRVASGAAILCDVPGAVDQLTSKVNKP